MIGSLFHFIKNVRLNLVRIGLYNNNIVEIIDLLLKNIGILPFKINDNNNIINYIFKEFDNKYSKEYKPFYNKFKTYFMTIWLKYFINSTLNDIYLDIIQCSN